MSACNSLDASKTERAWTAGYFFEASGSACDSALASKNKRTYTAGYVDAFQNERIYAAGYQL